MISISIEEFRYYVIIIIPMNLGKPLKQLGVISFQGSFVFKMTSIICINIQYNSQEMLQVVMIEVLFIYDVEDLDLLTIHSSDSASW